MFFLSLFFSVKMLHSEKETGKKRWWGIWQWTERAVFELNRTHIPTTTMWKLRTKKKSNKSYRRQCRRKYRTWNNPGACGVIRCLIRFSSCLQPKRPSLLGCCLMKRVFRFLFSSTTMVRFSSSASLLLHVTYQAAFVSHLTRASFLLDHPCPSSANSGSFGTFFFLLFEPKLRATYFSWAFYALPFCLFAKCQGMLHRRIRLSSTELHA